MSLISPRNSAKQKTSINFSIFRNYKSKLSQGLLLKNNNKNIDFRKENIRDFDLFEEKLKFT